MKSTFILAIAALGALTGMAQQPALSVADRAAVAQLDRDAVHTMSPHTRVAISQDKHTADSIVSVYLTVDETLQESALQRLGVNYHIIVPGIATARVPFECLSALQKVQGVKYVQIGTAASQMLDLARADVGINAVHAGTGFDSPFSGRGVIIGIVDSGFDYTHAAFTAPDGHLRISRVWEQTTQPASPELSPAAYGYGTELTTEEAILASGGDIYNNSHGSHVASIAAGNDPYLDYTLRGMAPDAELVLVSMVQAGYANVNISNAISYIMDYAKEQGCPCVINLSLGAHKGPHDGTSTFDVIADALQGPGRLIVGAAGNHRGNTYHVNKTWRDDTTPLRTYIDYQLNPSEKNRGGQIEIWGEADKDIEVALAVYKLSNHSQAERVVVYPTEVGTADVSLGRNISGTYTVATEVSPLNGKPHVLLTSQVTSIRTGYAIAIEVTPRAASTVDIWADATYFALTAHGADGFADPSGSTLSEIGGTAKRILTVGAYTTRSEYQPLGESVPLHLDETVGALGSFSCYGPTADGRIKPQITAPGCFISAAVSSWDHSGTLVYSQYHQENGHNNYYGYMQGTSMATPVVTGIVATWLEAYPDMTPEELADIAEQTARTDQYTGDLAERSIYWGAGKIDAEAGLRECLKRNTITDVVADSREAVIIVGGRLTFVRDMARATVEVYSTQGMLIDHIELTDVKAGDTHRISLPKGPSVLTVSHERSRTSKIVYNQ